MNIKYQDFRKIDIRVGTVLSLKDNVKARESAFILQIDFGESIGIKKTSAKITDYYNKHNLVGKQIIAVCNLPIKNIAGVLSEVLILGVVEEKGKAVLLTLSKKVKNGLPIY
tara:strand:- start:134 stop:469 length:336 start_codon:yes stop_codon:yes gene_type:complete